jgi:hypothetical protein
MANNNFHQKLYENIIKGENCSKIIEVKCNRLDRLINLLAFLRHLLKLVFKNIGTPKFDRKISQLQAKYANLEGFE